MKPSYMYKFKPVESLSFEDIVDGFIVSLYSILKKREQLEIEYGMMGVSKIYFANASNIRWSLSLKNFTTFESLSIALPNKKGEENDN